MSQNISHPPVLLPNGQLVPWGRGYFMTGLPALVGSHVDKSQWKLERMTHDAFGWGFRSACRHHRPLQWVWRRESNVSDPVILWSAPGSGNTMTRELIEQATGRFTTSIQQDRTLEKTLFPFECILVQAVGTPSCVLVIMRVCDHACMRHSTPLSTATCCEPSRTFCEPFASI